jgi:hypothetical protein
LLLIMSIAGILFVGTLSSVVADDEEYILEDDEGDVFVIDMTSEDLETTDEKPNIDIKQITYSKTDGSTDATLILEVYGTIEDRGGLDEEIELLNSVMYTITLYTSEDTYSFTYINNVCQLTYTSGSYDNPPINITDYTKSDGVLTIPFDLTKSSETYVDLEAYTADFSFDLSGEGGMYSDVAPDEEYIEATIEGPSNGDIGEELDFKGEAFDLYGTGTYSYHWNFDDGSTSNMQNATHAYSAEGEYEITLTVTDEDYNEAEATHTVTISSGEPTNGGNENGNDGSAGLLLFVAIIIIIALVGIAAVVYIIRR